jgi:hypothetical protein
MSIWKFSPGAVKTFAAAFALFAIHAGGPARAVPALQLDIVGGVYDAATETVVASGSSFTLLALATATGSTSAADILNETYYISAAIVPPVAQDPGFNAGSFQINGVTINATDGNMIYGTPPTEGLGNPNLPGHGIFDSYYLELAFQFSAADTTTTYNSQDNAGGALFDEAGAGSFFLALEIDVSGLAPGRLLHFDLYNTKVKNNGAVTIDDFAPFSHDAESTLPSGPVPDTGVDVPEPASLAVFLTGLAAAFRLRRRRTA